MNKALSSEKDTGQDLQTRISTYWDTRSEDFAQKREQELSGASARAWSSLLEEHLGKQPLRILDIGTGAGFFAILLARLGHEVTGIDASPAMIACAARLAKRHVHSTNTTDTANTTRPTFAVMDAACPAFPPLSFDALVTRNLTWTLPDVMVAYRAWYHLLKAGGRLINFDADRGEVSFQRTDSPTNVHADVEESQLIECNAIKDALRISTHRRPTFDRLFLEELGFAVTITDDVTPLVAVDPNLTGEGLPLFMIQAIKPLQ